ncbi:hypothetical protein [Bradyrhizobium sp.]|uniref:hypothetical protein n=1 Tax=Bradyrhizobium sp. TaxID=376 RepID=UPI003C1A867F
MRTHPEWIDKLVGQPIATPAYVFSPEEMSRQMRKLGAALGTRVIFSVSACPNSDLLMRQAEDVRFGVRCSSKAEMGLVAGWRTDYAFVTLPSMDEQTMRAVLGARFRLIVDASQQIELLASLRGKREVVPISLGVSVGLIEGCSDRGGDDVSRFGMDWDDLRLAIALARRHGVPVGGLYVFGGANSFGGRSLAIVRAMRDLAAQVEAELGGPLDVITIGAGLEAGWENKGHDFAAYRAEIAKFASHIQIIHDVGRAAIASAGCFVTKVVARKNVNGRSYAICDGGMAQAYLLSKAARDQQLKSNPLVCGAGLELRQSNAARCAAVTTIVGGSLSRDDILAETNTDLNPGDLLFFPQAGAYCRTYTPGEYLGQGYAASYVL